MLASDAVDGTSSSYSSSLTAEALVAGNGGKKEDEDLGPTVDPHHIFSGSIIAGGVKERPPRYVYNLLWHQ